AAPLVFEAFNWQHGVFVGATMVSETTAAATGKVGVPRNDPMAMIPFCGYNMADYFGHWLSMQKRLKSPPRVFHVNWFRTDADGNFLWPGFGDNVRVLKWIVDRVHQRADAKPTPIGLVPAPDALDLGGLNLDADHVKQLFEVDPTMWFEESEMQRAFFQRFGDRLPAALWHEHEALIARITQDAAFDPAPNSSHPAR
ncbi:MAG TPA: phosphoenolpyruvate carboxykinase domain-containing protein, partial [Polyangiaceae bacterium]|nr:phosphoenolpyruvate carboxykinase domain-containing protein [Polyangiaceae bacterium]